MSIDFNDIEEIPFDSLKGIEYKYSEKELVLEAFGVTSLIVGLLPHKTAITLKSLEVKNGDEFHDLNDVKNIRDMVFILRELGRKRVDKYVVDFKNGMGNVTFNENEVF